jgi:ABC-type nitrate/sulfonate/bicarbonate transport system permease component
MTSAIRHRILVWGLRIALIAVLLGLWLYGNGPGHVSTLLLPIFSGVVTTLGQLVIVPTFWSAVAETLFEMAIAFVIAAVVGTLLGFWAARGPLRAKTIEPLAVWGYMAPLFLFYPLFLLWFGVDAPSKISLAAVSSVFPIIYGSIRAFRSVDEIYLRVGRAYGATNRQIDWLIKLRASLPVLASAFRIGAAYSITTVLAAEVLSSLNGLGYLLAQAAQSFNASEAFALVFAIVVIVALLQMLLNRVFSVRHQQDPTKTN